MNTPKTLITEDPLKDLQELTHIVINLRHYTKLWDEHYGSRLKDSKKLWEANADTWIEKHLKPNTDAEDIQVQTDR